MRCDICGGGQNESGNTVADHDGIRLCVACRLRLLRRWRRGTRHEAGGMRVVTSGAPSRCITEGMAALIPVKCGKDARRGQIERGGSVGGQRFFGRVLPSQAAVGVLVSPGRPPLPLPTDGLPGYGGH